MISGAKILANSLKNQGVSIVFGVVGIPVIEIAEALISVGIQFISFRHEQSAVYV
jgi:2-hydroxyacyl-CoA lyase 1